MKSYDATMREIKVKDLKRQAMQQTIDHAVLLKARALNDEKKTVAKAEKGKVEYLEAKLDQAQQSLEAAKTAGTSDLPPEVAGNLVAEEEENVRSISLKLRQEKNKERKMKLIAKRHKTEKGVENDLHRRKELLAQAKAAYNKHLAMNYVEEEAEQHTKQRESAKLKESERQRKRKITEELAVKRSAAKESQEKTLENRNKGLEQAKLLESTDPNACQVSAWSSYGQCSKPCGGGMQTSTRSVIKPGANPQSCPSLAKGKPCNMHACPEPQARKSTSEEACAAMISACGEFQARVSACEAHPKVDLAKQPMSNETQMIIATEYSKPDPLDDPTTVYHYLDQPDEPLDHDIDIHDMGEAAEIRAAIAHLPSTARLLLASPPHDHEVEFCATAKKEAARHCKIAKDCVGSHNNVGESLSDDLSSQKVPMYARPVSAIGQHAKGKYPQDQEFDETLSHLVLGPAGGH